MSELKFGGKVAIVTGAGNGLGKSHALLLASRGARVVVNDLGGDRHGGGKSSSAADQVVQEIKAAGGEAVANYDSVEDGAKIVQCAMDTFGGIDVVVNNAGILRDVSFQKMTQDDWDLVYRVHVLGSFRVTHAAWNHMRDKGYGRIVMTASAAGIYGNFGQANYAMAKLGLVGLAQTLALEGKKKNVLVNVIAPIAGSRLTETVLPPELLAALKPEYVSPLVAWLCHESCTETGGTFEVGGGFLGKVRWERAAGHTFRVGRAITPEAVKEHWKAITGFEKTTHPTDINSSMQPILENIQKPPSKGGNQFIDVDLALGHKFPKVESSYDERDLALYALSIGAGADPLDKSELRFVYEMHGDGFLTIPTYGVIPAIGTLLKQAKEGLTAPGLNYGFERILHGEQYLEVKRPLPPKAKLVHEARIKDIFDKGRHALVTTEIVTKDADTGEELVRNDATMLVRGAGGWGGERGPTEEKNVAPDRKPDAVVEEKTHQNQALLYRLTGDWNPLHADPDFAKGFGFERPILHGLCTFGYAARAVIKAMSNNDPRFFKSILVRFTDTVFPGETLVTEMWRESKTRVVFRCKVKERDKVVISNAAVELFEEIPKPAAKAAPKAAAAAAAPAALGSADIFVAITDYVSKHPELVKEVNTVFQFKLSAPESAWVLDLKAGKVSQGTAPADCTLELTDADFLDMSTGKADAQKLYFGGKLKISGNVMASQKLMFLKKVDASAAADAIAKARGGAAPAAASPAADDGALRSGDIFVAIKDYVEKHPELIKEVNTVFQFKLSGPDSAWVVDLKAGKIEAGTATADCTLELTDADFLDMSTGKADAQKLYFGGKLKISGNVMASQKLMFLKKVDPKQAEAAIKAARAAGAPAATAAPAAKKEALAKKVMDTFAERLAKNPALAGEVGAVLQFYVTGPDSQWVVDLGASPGVREGKANKSDTQLQLADEDLAALARGTTTGKDLFQRGLLKVGGDFRPAHKLHLFKVLA